MGTSFPSAKDIGQRWLTIDASNQRLGRLASEVARILQGKDSPLYTPFLDTGRHVIVYNASRIIVTGKKEAEKSYFSHTARPGSGRIVMYSGMLKRYPDRIIINAVKGMLPKNRLGRQMVKKLKVYSGEDHPHSAQCPTEYYCHHLDLRDAQVFRSRLRQQYAAWISSLPEPERNAPSFGWGNKMYSPTEICLALNRETALGLFYSGLMYSYHFARFDKLRDEGKTSAHDSSQNELRSSNPNH